MDHVSQNTKKSNPVASELRARIFTWDIGFKPESEDLWLDRVETSIEGALKDKIDVLVFPELIGWGLSPYRKPHDVAASFVTQEWRSKLLPRLAKKLSGQDILVNLGSYPHHEIGWKHKFNRGTLWLNDGWIFADKLDPTQPETLEDPPIHSGAELPIFSFRGGTVASLTCYSVEKPEIAAQLKTLGVHMLLVPSATSDEHGVGRILRTASARAVELGAAVLVAPLTGAQGTWSNMGVSALFLPDQNGFKVQPLSPLYHNGIHHRDFYIPWGALLGLRTQSQPPETRPFLAPSPSFKITTPT